MVSVMTQRVFICGVKNDLCDMLSKTLAKKVFLKKCESVIQGNDLSDFNYVIIGCDYNCALDSCVRRFILLYQNKRLPYTIIRPVFLKQRFGKALGFFLSSFEEQPVCSSQEIIFKLLINSEYCEGSPRFLVPPYSSLSKILKAQREIIENPSQSCSLSSVAEKLHCSRSWLSSKFQELLGFYLQSFLVKMRCCHGLWQIVSTDKQIKNIAMEAGYKPLYFSQLFHQVFNASPSSVRSKYCIFN
jgi:AraC-like DNA-binding protein